MEDAGLVPGLQAEAMLLVAPEHLASRWGSGGVEVLATPQMIGLMELAAVRAVDALLPEGYCTVGAQVSIRHVAATPLGGHVTARARLEQVDGRRLVFQVIAVDDSGLVGEGTHERYIVERERFVQRAVARAVAGQAGSRGPCTDVP